MARIFCKYLPSGFSYNQLSFHRCTHTIFLSQHDYELLLGDYTEIEEWISDGRVDCGFLRLPTSSEFETIFLEQDRLLAILPENHPLAQFEKVPVAALCDEPFMLLEKGAKAEVSEIFDRCNLTPRVHFTTWDDYAIMSMVESGLGISILPELIFT